MEAIDLSISVYLFLTFAYKVNVYDQFLYLLILQGLDMWRL